MRAGQVGSAQGVCGTRVILSLWHKSDIAQLHLKLHLKVRA
jgi:hypothetical protein